MIKNFLRFFDKTGSDLNLASRSNVIKSLYDNSQVQYESLSGKLFFPVVSVNLIESQNLYLLQEVTGPTNKFNLRKIQGSVTLTGGNPNVIGTNSDFTSLTGGDTLKILDTNYTVNSVFGATSMSLTATPSISITTNDIYLYDYLSYAEPRTEIGTFSETLRVLIPEKEITSTQSFFDNVFFLYDVDYTEDVPYIKKHREFLYQLADGSTDSIDPTTGRVSLSQINTVPVQINLGISSSNEYVYEESLLMYLDKEYRETLTISPSYTNDYDTFYISGTSHNLFDISEVFLEGGTGSSPAFYSQPLDIVEVGITGSHTYVNVKKLLSSPVGSSNFSGYRLKWVNSFNLAEIVLYGEVEGEDERFRLVLENFGKKINYENEYIFRDSDINEGLTDYILLNQKRKELLLEGDNIYPYLGSYKALINILNYFGYYDVRIKEYFLNVNEDSSNFGKYMHVLVPKNAAQREEVKAAWSILPSNIYKKTSLFGLFYDLNKASSEVDIYGIPEVVDAFDFSAEEVLIKLFGLKELLKKEYLPLNARIYDITGEGIYFERIRVDSWVDNLHHLVLDLGKIPEFNIYPPKQSYIADIRRMDQFYIEKFIAQGLTGFLGASATLPGVNAIGYTGSISSLYGTFLDSYNNYLKEIYDEDGNLLPVVDSIWSYMPPGIDEPNFNEIAARMNPLPDEKGIVAAAPVLLESFFNITWEESYFNWSHLGILGPTAAPLNINLWTWDSIGRGDYIDMRWTVQKSGENGFFYDSGRRPIEDFVKTVKGATAFSLPGKVTVEVSGGSIVEVYINSPGYGYLFPPSVFVPPPDTPGTQATITLSVSEGYISGATWSAGAGYTYPPTITVAPPPVTYESVNKILHAVALPYEGEYDVALYNYDITNSYTVQFDKYKVISREADFVSSFRRESSERRWEQTSNIFWKDANSPWYYPNFVNTRWQDSQVSWESLDFANYQNQSLYEYSLSTSVYSIDRLNPSITLLGNLTNNLPNSLTLSIGDFIFLTRDEFSPIIKNLEIPVDSFSSKLQGLSGGSPFDAVLSANVGDLFISTNFYDTTNYISPGDYLWTFGEWYTITAVGATHIGVASPVVASFSSQLALSYPSSLEVEVGYSSNPIVMSRYSKVLFTENCDYDSVNPLVDFYRYADGLTASTTALKVTSDQESLRELILKNSSLLGNLSLYATWGIFSGTYSLEISNISLVGGNTLLRLNDPNKELYYLDGNFNVEFSDYDVDYAETRIGTESLKFENLNELTWSENEFLTWFGTEYHGGVLCGYVIPFVSPGGSITVDEEATFFFSGNSSIDNSFSGLTIAAAELNSSLNSGISKYSYEVLPDLTLFLRGASSESPVTVGTTASIGFSQISLNETPGRGSLKIPAEISVIVSGGSVTGVIIVNPGYGYVTAPTVTVSSPGCTGTPATITCVMSGLPFEGTISSVFFTGGSGYTSVPTVTVDPPSEFKPYDNYVWTGNEWVKVIGVTGATGSEIILENTLNYQIDQGENLLLPYQYHKQLYLNPNLMQQFYYFIHGKAKNPSNEMLSYINFELGTESEWANHPDRTYTYPLRNSILNLSIPQYADLRQDYLYNKWVFEGSDYPPLNIYPDYSSDVLSYESRIPYSMTLQSSFSFIDTEITTVQKRIPQFTPTIFHFDNCRIPGKNNPLWTIKNDETNKVEVISAENKLMWNFTKPGKFSVSLRIQDSNGNLSSTEKKSFFIVE